MACATPRPLPARPRNPRGPSRPARRSRGPWRSPGPRIPSAAERTGPHVRTSPAPSTTWFPWPKRPPLKGARPAPVERQKMCSVVLWQHEEPTKTIQIAVVGMLGRCLQVGLGRELRDEPLGRGDSLLDEAPDARAADVRGSRAGLPGPAGRPTLCQPEPGEGHASLNDKQVGRHLTEPPVVVRPLEQGLVGGLFHPINDPVPLDPGHVDQKADRLPK